LKLFQKMERDAGPRQKLNWRFQQALYRASYDAYVRARLLHEADVEAEVREMMRQARRVGSLKVLTAAEAVMDREANEPPAPELRARVFELAEALFQSIRMQLSVPRYKAIATERGANIDAIDLPLNDRGWLESQFAEIRKSADERERLAAIDAIVNRTNPGPGGFYDDLGNLTRQPHLVRGAGFDKDPAYFESSLVGFAMRSLGGPLLTDPRAWWDHAESLYEAPLEMYYPGLDPSAEYKLRVVYAGDATRPEIRLVAGDGIEIHPLLSRPIPFRPLEFDIPHAATANGDLRLKWYREPGLGDAGRGTQVAEVWLIRK